VQRVECVGSIEPSAEPLLQNFNSAESPFMRGIDLCLFTLPASIRRMIGRQQPRTLKFLPSPRTKVFEIPYDEITTIYKRKTNDPIFLKV